MSTVRPRCLIVGMMILFGMASPPPVLAQFLSKVGQVVTRIPDPLALPQDVLEERYREHRLHHAQARLQQDLEQGNADRIQRDLRRIRVDEYLVEQQRWDIRRDSFQAPGPYPSLRATTNPTAVLVPHPQYPGYGFLAADPTRLYLIPPANPADHLPATAATRPVKVPITIRNANPAAEGVAFAIDGNRYQVAGGQSHQFEVDPASIVIFDRGGSAGPLRHSLSTGAYEFRRSDGGWVLYKLPTSPAVGTK